MNRELMARQMFANGGVAKMEEGGEPSAYELSPEELRQLKDQLYDMESGRVLESDRQKLFDILEKLKGRERLEDRIGRFLESVPVYPRNPPVYPEAGPISGERFRDMAPGRPFITPKERMPMIPPTPFLTPREQGNPEDMIRLLRMRDQIEASPGRMSQQEMQMIKDRNYAYGGPVYKMQEGGVPPVNPMAGMPVSPDAAMPPMAGAAGVDPAMMEQMLMQAQQNITALDDAETAEEVMNAMRGDQASIEERRMELAQIVGEGDAQSTPESVLTLVQPVMMMAQVDQGIGGLAQDQMNQPVTGDMAGGIMSTVDMGAQEGPAPVNFKYGGVVKMGFGGIPPFTALPNSQANPQANPNAGLETAFQRRLPLYQQLAGIDPAEQQRQKSFDEAQALFAISRGALRFVAPGERQMSPAEKFAIAAEGTLQDISGISAKAAERRAIEEAGLRQAKFGALQAAEADITAQAKYAADKQLEELKAAQEISKIGLTKSLDLTNSLMIEDLKQSGDLNLERLRQTGAKNLEDVKSQLEYARDVLKSNLKFDTDTRLQNQAFEIDKQLKDIDFLNTVNELGLKSTYDLDLQQKALEGDITKIDLQAQHSRELAEANRAAQKEIAELDRKIAEKNMRINFLRYKSDAASQAEATKLNREKYNLEVRKQDWEEEKNKLMDLGNSFDANVITKILGNADLLKRYKSNKLREDEALFVNNALAKYTAPKSVWNPTTNREEKIPGNPLSKEWASAVSGRISIGGTAPGLISGESSAGASESDASPDLKKNFLQLLEGAQDLKAASGAPAFIRNLFNKSVELLSFNLFDLPAPNTAAAISVIDGMNLLTSNWLVAAFPGRDQTTNQLREQILANLPKPASLTSGTGSMIHDIEKVIAIIEVGKDQLQAKNQPGVPTSGQVADIEAQLTGLNQLSESYQLLLEKFKGGGSGKTQSIDEFMQNRVNRIQ